MLKNRNLYALFLMIAVVSFLGFIVENIFLALTLRFVDNRNMHLPLLLGYGVGVAALYLLCGTPRKPRFLTKELHFKHPLSGTAYVFLVACLGVMAGEIAVGTLVEKTCDIIWWEYTTLPLHITKYTSVPTTLGFGALITLFMQYLFTPIFEWCKKRINKGMAIFACVLMVLMVLDLAATAVQMYQTNYFVEVWRFDF